MRTLIVSILVLMSTGFLIFLFYDNDSDMNKPITSYANTLPTEQFIIKHLMNNDGTIRTDFSDNDKSVEALAESMGLWMEYLALKDEPEQFEIAVNTMKKHFLSKEKLVMWEIQGNKKAHTNALIDDLRIIEALYDVGDKEQRDDYLKLAEDMSSAVLKNNRENERFVDFYDRKFKHKSKSLTLSYINPKPLEHMLKVGLFSDQEMNDLKAFMENIPANDVFYPINYDLNDENYYLEETVNLIDQIYIAIYLEGFDISTIVFYNWIKEMFYENNIIYGRYNQETLEKDVDYESVAVYALAIIYSLEKNDPDFAIDLYDKMKEHQITDLDSPYFGGYVFSDQTHSFDNLLALIAERMLLNEYLIK